MKLSISSERFRYLFTRNIGTPNLGASSVSFSRDPSVSFLKTSGIASIRNLGVPFLKSPGVSFLKRLRRLRPKRTDTFLSSGIQASSLHGRLERSRYLRTSTAFGGEARKGTRRQKISCPEQNIQIPYMPPVHTILSRLIHVDASSYQTCLLLIDNPILPA